MFELLFSGSVTATCLVAGAVGLLAYWLIQKRKYNYPPGPRGLPLLGNMLQLNQSTLYKDIFEMSEKYKSPVLTIQLGTMTIVFVNKLEAAMEVLVKKSTDFAGRMMIPTLDLFTYGGKSIAFSSYGPAWKLHRRIATKALRQYMQGNALEQRINDAVQTAFEEMDKLGTAEFDPTKYINFIIVNILMGLCFGGKYSFGDKEVQFLIEKEDEVIETFSEGAPEDFIPGLQYVYKSGPFKKIEQFIDEVLENFMRRKYKEEERTFDKNNIRHFCDNLFLARQEALEEGEDLSQLTEDHLVQTLDDIFFAGIDTSRLTLNWAINHMIAFPDIQAKVQEEIDRVVGKDRLPGVADRPHLSYTEAVLHESMRLSSVVPFGIFHMSLCDTTVAGYKIPKGTQVAINHWGLHHDPEAWEDVDRFIPERFLDEDGKLGPKPKNWLPFSAGKRVCLGEFVAKPELHLLFASLMQRYTWKVKSGKCADLSPYATAFSLTCKPYKVIAEKRV